MQFLSIKAMTDSLIINARPHLRWHRRIFSDASTAMLWGFWLWLWRPLLSLYGWLVGLHAGLQPVVLKMLNFGGPVSIEGSAVALVSTSSTLLLWSALTPQQNQKPQVNQLQDYASHFGLSEQHLLSGRNSSVCVVHHDEHGRIVRIETRA